MTFQQWYALEGALITVALGFLALAVLVYLAELVRDAMRWRRLVRVCGSEAKALDVVGMEERFRAGFRAANKRGWLNG